MPCRSMLVRTLLILALATAVGNTSSASEPAAADSKPTATAETGPRPKLEIPEMVVEPPAVAKGETMAADFVIKNTGTAPLEISEVRPACGCTVASFDKVIPPGGSGTIHAVVDTKNLSGGSARTITVFSNDPMNPRSELTVMVKVEEYLTFNPGFARFTQGQGFKPGSVKQLFTSPLFDDLKILSVESPYPFMKVEHREATPEERKPEIKGRQHVVTVILDYDAAPVGALNSQVLVHTNHPKQPIGRLTVSGFVRPRVHVTPPLIQFGELDASAPTTARLLVQNFTPQPLHVTKVEQGLAGGEATFKVSEEGKKYYVELTLPSGLAKGPFSTELKIHTDSAKDPLLVVPISGTVL